MTSPTPMKVELKPCPCGQDDMFINERWNLKSVGALVIRCIACGREAVANSVDDVIAMWNIPQPPSREPEEERITPEMIKAALNARVPGGSQVWWWLPQKDAWTPHETASDVIRCALIAALTLPEQPRPVETSRAFEPTDEEQAAIEKIAADQELSNAAVMRQALRLYQLTHERAKAGETFSFSGDAQRAAEFAGLALPRPVDDVEIGWLIEHDGEPKWLTLKPAEAFYKVCWSRESLDALRFSRRQDAEAYVWAHFGGEGPVRITEHQWIPSARAALGQKDGGGE